MQTTPLPASTSWPVPDYATRYGSISRIFHWGMALLFVVIFSAALARYFAKDSALDSFLWPLHRPTGALLMLLVVLRAAWPLVQVDRALFGAQFPSQKSRTRLFTQPGFFCDHHPA